jgi:hypothetical protein
MNVHLEINDGQVPNLLSIDVSMKYIPASAGYLLLANEL